MGKTIAVQMCLVMAALYGLINVILTELSGEGLCSTLKHPRRHRKNGKISVLAANRKATGIIYLDVIEIPYPERNCFKYFTAQDGTWVETCIPTDAPNHYSEK